MAKKISNKKLSKLAKDRLTTLVKLLETVVPANKFDMGTWISTYGNIVDLFSDDYCGTTACAAGWACTLPEFQLAGLSLDNGAPRYNGYSFIPALEQFFDLEGSTISKVAVEDEVEHDVSVADYFFLPDYYFNLKIPTEEITPKQVAARIKKYVRENS